VLEQAHRSEADARPEQVDEAGDEQGDTHDPVGSVEVVVGRVGVTQYRHADSSTLRP